MTPLPTKSQPRDLLKFEQQARQQGFRFIIGIDEAGRGPLAGPVVAAAVFLKKHRFQNKIADSKKISPRQRERAFLEILENAHVGVGVMNETVIDELNILKATHQAMTSAVNHLILRLPGNQTEHNRFLSQVHLLVDGNSFKSDLPFSYQTIVRGDDQSTSIACASIVAKVTRDRILLIYDRIFPQYGFKRHKGYPTKDHRKAIQQFGLSPIHRRTFKPCFARSHDGDTPFALTKCERGVPLFIGRHQT